VIILQKDILNLVIDTKIVMMVKINNLFALLSLFSFLVCFFLPINVLGVDNSTWDSGEDMHTNRTEVTGEVLDDRIFVIGGADYQEDGAVDTVEIYDPETNEWSSGPSLPYVLDHAPSVVYDGKIFVMGGFVEGKTTTDKTLIYDPETNEWSEGTPLPSPRAAAVAEVVNGSIYLISGLDIEHHPVSINEVYHIENDTWTSKASMPGDHAPKHHAASAELDGKIYVIGGRLFGNGVPNEINDALTNLDDNWMYDPVKDNWTQMESMPIRRSGFTADDLNGKIYVFGGQAAEGSIENSESYDPIEDNWAIEPNMMIDRSGLSAVAYNDKIYVFGGQHEGLQALSANEILAPGTN
jgi:N-acetylneuraminic acid mutarotase